jgi:hypothetical protein
MAWVNLQFVIYASSGWLDHLRRAGVDAKVIERFSHCFNIKPTDNVDELRGGVYA